MSRSEKKQKEQTPREEGRFIGGLRDILYDKNDLLVCLLIVFVALVVIWGRMGVILHYPEVLAAEQRESR